MHKICRGLGLRGYELLRRSISLVPVASRDGEIDVVHLRWLTMNGHNESMCIYVHVQYVQLCREVAAQCLVTFGEPAATARF